LPEPDIDGYGKDWEKRTRVARFLTRAESVGVQLYRRSRAHIANGQRIRGLVGSVASVAMRPRLIHARALIALSVLAKRETV